MSYHDRKIDTYEKTGIGVVNPLLRIEQKLTKIKNIVLDEEKHGELSKDDLLERLAEILNE